MDGRTKNHTRVSRDNRQDESLSTRFFTVATGNSGNLANAAHVQFARFEHAHKYMHLVIRGGDGRNRKQLATSVINNQANIRRLTKNSTDCPVESDYHSLIISKCAFIRI